MTQRTKNNIDDWKFSVSSILLAVIVYGAVLYSWETIEYIFGEVLAR